jgi:hypothetical protein
MPRTKSISKKDYCLQIAWRWSAERHPANGIFNGRQPPLICDIHRAGMTAVMGGDSIALALLNPIIEKVGGPIKRHVGGRRFDSYNAP